MYAFAFLRKRNPIRMQSRGCTYTIRKNVEGNGTAWVAALGNDRGYDDDLHPISPVIVALRGNIALQRKKLGRSVEEVTPHTPQKSQQAMKIDNPATKWTPATAHHRELQRAGAWPGPSSSHRKRAPCHSCNSDRSEPALLRSIRSQRSVQASSDVKSQNTVITSAARDLLFLGFGFRCYDSSTRSVTAATCAISATSCTRTMCAPPRMLAATVAAVAKSRPSGGTGLSHRSVASFAAVPRASRFASSKAPSLARASVWPRNPLREVPTRSG